MKEPDPDFIARAEENYWPDFVDDAHAVMEAMQQLGPKVVAASLREYRGPDSEIKDNSGNSGLS